MPGKDEFTLVVFDEATFPNDPKRGGTKYWSPGGEPIVTTYNGRHEKVAACGAIATGGTQFSRTYEKSGKDPVLECPKELYWHWKGGSDYGQRLAAQARNSHGVPRRQPRH